MALLKSLKAAAREEAAERSQRGFGRERGKQGRLGSRSGKGGDQDGNHPYILSTRTAVPPDIPIATETGPLAPIPDFWGRDALVVAVVPLSDVFRDLDASRAGVFRPDCLGLGAVW